MNLSFNPAVGTAGRIFVNRRKPQASATLLGQCAAKPTAAEVRGGSVAWSGWR